MSSKAEARKQQQAAAAADKAAAAAAAAAAPGGRAHLPLPELLPPPGAAAASHLDDDSHVDQNATALLQSALLGGDADDDDEADEGNFAAVAAAINRLIKVKQGKKQQKQAAVLQDLQDTVTAALRDFEAAAAKEAKELEKLVTTSFGAQQRKLTDKFKTIEVVNAKYQADLKAAWQDYNDIFTRVEDAKDQTMGLLHKRQTAQKRKLAALQESLAATVADAEGRLSKLTNSAAKQRHINDLLRCFTSTADE